MTYAQQMKIWARRRAKFIAQRENGWTLQRIADKAGITRQRVIQIVGTTKKKENGNETGEGPIRVS